jgi:hypothetical protein
MLTETEKNKIELEEKYRQEIKSRLKVPPSFSDKIDGPIKVLQGLAIAIGIAASLIQYSINSRQERSEAAREYQKTFYQEQMRIYSEAVNATSIIATADVSSDEYNKARAEFLRLFWGRMSMFEDKCVEARMVEFRKLLIKFEQEDYSFIEFQYPCDSAILQIDTVSQVTLKQSSLRLAHQTRLYTINTWLPEEERKQYN